MKLDRIILFLFLLTNCKASTIVTLDCNPIESELWVPYGSKDIPIDTLRSITLIFERDFDDTLEVTLNGVVIVEQYFKTNMKLSMVESIVKIDLPINYGSKSEIKIYNHKYNSCSSFKIKKGYCFYYIQKTDANKWYLQYSNFSRKYY